MREDVLQHSSRTSGGQPAWMPERLEWFRKQRFGIILHWGIYAFWDCCESWPLVPEDTWARNDGMRCWVERGRDIERFQKEYWDLIERFDPTGFDPDRWAETFAASGAKYVCLTTKHHDGFCMWNTATTDYKVTGPRCPFRTHRYADIVGHLSEALRRAGLGVSVYFSKADWHCPDYWAPELKPFGRGANTLHDPERWDRFVRYTHEQIRELLTNYGKVDILWLDAGWVSGLEDIRMPELVSMARSLQPGLLVANRTVGDFEDFVTPEREVPDADLGVPWEACQPLGSNWKYVEGERLRTAAEVYRELTTVNQNGGNYLLGIGPKPDGTLPIEAETALRELGCML